jgi:molecular chaperone GrpE
VTDENNVKENDADDVYVLEDTGETLEDFSESGLAPAEDEKSQGASASASSEEVQKLRDENLKLRDQALRARADFDNFRKRAEREKTDYFKYALGGVVQNLLPVVDNFQRALDADTSNIDDFRTGIEMIAKQLADVLQKAGVTEVEATGTFNPMFHEAVMREETTDVPSHTILSVLQKGYRLNDRLLRPALVKVAVGGPESKQAPEEAEPESQD